MAQTRSQDKTAAKQNDIRSNKKPRVLTDESLSANETVFSALSQGLCANWLVCIAYCIFWHLIGSDQLSYLHSLPICKGKPYLKLSKLILNWTDNSFADNILLTNSYIIYLVTACFFKRMTENFVFSGNSSEFSGRSKNHPRFGVNIEELKSAQKGVIPYLNFLLHFRSYNNSLKITVWILYNIENLFGSG